MRVHAVPLTIFLHLINNPCWFDSFFPFSSNLTGNIYFCNGVDPFIITTLSGNKDYWVNISQYARSTGLVSAIMSPVELIGMPQNHFINDLFIC
jgi:F-type H+-transporting ATPase subunit a